MNMRTCVAAALGLALAAPHRLPAWSARPPAPQDSVVYRVHPSSLFEVHAGKSGLLAGFGHEHRVRAHAFRGTIVYFPAEPQRSRVEITVLTDSLKVVPEADSADIPKITEAMRSQTLRVDSFPEIRFVSREVAAEAAGEAEEPGSTAIRVSGDFTMVGQTRPVSVVMHLTISGDTLRAEGSFVVKQRDFGIKPYSKALGMVKVKNEVRLELNVVAVAQGPERPASIRVLREMPVASGSPQVSVVEPFIAVNPADGRQRAGAAVRLDDARWTVIGFATADGGETWQARELPGQAGAEMAADPWLYWSPDGTAYLSVLAFVPSGQRTRVADWMYRSRDGGRSWSDPVQLPWAERGSYDHAILTSDPRLAGGPLYLVATVGVSGLAVLRSESGVEGFAGPVVFSPDSLNNNLGGAVALGERRLVFTHFDMSTPDDQRPLWSVRSEDGGRSFERTLIRRGVVPWGFPQLAADLSRSRWAERLYAAWLEASGGEGLNVMLAHSDDDGRTWSAPVPVNAQQAPVFRGRPFIAVNQGGVVGVAWNDRRNAEGRLCSDVYFAASVDGGESFLREARVSTVTSCHPQNLARRWAMGGDYSNVSTTSDGHFHIVWSDARSGTYQPYAAEAVVARQ